MLWAFMRSSDDFVKCTYGEQPPTRVVTMSIRNHYLLLTDEPAAIRFFSDVEKDEMVFLILVMVYSEARRAQRNGEAVRSYFLSTPTAIKFFFLSLKDWVQHSVIAGSNSIAS